MIYSMTGYGRAAADGLTLEIKAVNHRYLDVSVRLPRSLSFLEDALKKRVSAAVSRGKVEVNLSAEKDTDALSVEISMETAGRYIEAIRALGDAYDISGEVRAMDLLRLPEVVTVKKTDVDEEALAVRIDALCGEALESFNAMRAAEGERLVTDIVQKSYELERLTGLIEQRSPVTVAAYRARLTQRLKETLENVNIEESRLLTEAAIFSDKVSVDEETVRLRSHITALRDMLAAGGTIGRKLDFLAQELGRESNTVGSKGNDIEMGRLVVDLKTEVEKIREQVQNIE